jgi:acyl transferase domain-containing protein/acyl carrier protein
MEPKATAATPLTRALETIRRLKAQIDEQGTNQPIAVVGVGLRFPGGIEDMESYWQALSEGRDLVGRMSQPRRARFPAEWATLPHKGGYLDDVTSFDAGFFGISPREARALDPQHRLLLEVSSEALEDAGLPPNRLQDAHAGVFLGITGQDYRDWQTGEPDAYWATGNGHCFAAGRVAYTLGLTGPTMAVDTACSSSLVAVHLAAQALRRGDCKVALAGGVNLVLSPRSTRLVRETRSLAPDGLCKAFDASANGFTRGEGAAMLTLKRLDHALRDGDRVHAVIHGSAVNHDGRSSGFTAPNVLAQISLIEAALADAGLSAKDIGLVETHGTGTALGDPIEMEAIIQALGRKNSDTPLYIGAVKTNFGHLEAAAGVAGLIKAIACIRHGAIPPIVHFRTLNPRIDLDGTSIKLPTRLEAWNGCGRYAGVSSFGMSGTNAHVVIGPSAPREVEASPVVGFEISAKTEEALCRVAATYAKHLEHTAEEEYASFAYTTSFGRTRHPLRAYVEATNRDAAIRALSAIAEGMADAAVTRSEREAAIAPLSRHVMDLPHYPWEHAVHAPDFEVPDQGYAPVQGASTPPALHVIGWEPAPLGDLPNGTTLVIAGDDAAAIHAVAQGAGDLHLPFAALTGSELPQDEAGWNATWAAQQPHAATLVLALRGATLPDEVDARDVAGDGAALCAFVVEAVRAAERHGRKVYVLTSGARQVTPDESVTLNHHALLNGLAPVLGLEFSSSWGGVVDLAPQPSREDGAAVVRLVLVDGNEDVAAIRNGTALVARLRPTTANYVPTIVVRADATYVITGGLGVIGRTMAMDLVRRGARHLLLIGRTPESALGVEAQTFLAALRQDGIVVTYRAIDCDDGKALAETLEQAPDDAALPPVRGVIHGAGTLAPMPIDRLDAAGFAAALRGKYSGAWWLHLLTRGYELDFFVMLSSVTAVWGTDGYGAYGAANGGLQLAVAARSAASLAAASIAYGPWELDGMADEASRANFARLGVSALAPDAACAALAATLPMRGTELIACDLDWPRFLEVMSSRRYRGIFAGVAATVATAEPVAAFPVPGLRLKIGALPRAARPDAVRSEVRRILAKTLGHADPQAVRNDTGFFDLGLDSIMAIDFAREISAAFDVDVQMATIFDRPTVNDLAALLTERLLDNAGASPPALPVVAPVATAAAPIPVLDRAHADETSPAAAQRPQDLPEPIAIVGMAGRFPGADSVEAFWELLCEGRDGVGRVPAERFDIAALHDADPLSTGKITTDQGGFLSDIARFDAQFFNIPAREAESLDPQQRLLLEATWHALENANIDPKQLKGTRTSVFVGISNSDYARLLEQGGLSQLDAYFGSGTALNAAAGRIAYVLGSHGPALAVDTACSSSLVAIHLAVRSLRNGESDCVLSGGVNVITAPSCSVAVSRAHMLSPDGRCKTFSAEANGFVRTEGCGMLVLKRLSDAERGGDTILALIRGSAVNHDGASSGLTVPSGKAQQAVISAALADAAVAPSRISFLEAHGTGTALGDPIELDAAWSVLGHGRNADAPLYLGSVKSNIGHGESSAGVLALIKIVLALRHRQLPPNLHCQNLNPHIRWDEVNMRVVDRLTPWLSDTKRVAGVSGFGFSGTNAHIILEESPQDAPAPSASATVAAGPFLLPLSAPDDAGLARLRSTWCDSLDLADDAALPALVAVAGAGRAHFAVRRAVLGNTKHELLAALRAARTTQPAGREPRVAFLFSGQGSQYFGMGQELYHSEPVFRAVIDDCDRILTPLMGASVKELMLFGGDKDAINETWVTQPALVALELALAELWRSYGVTATVVLGHSVGEIAAAIYAGVVDRTTGLTLIAHRARLMQSAQRGAMLAVNAPLDRVSRWIDGTSLDIAVINGSEAIVVAGTREEVDALAGRLKEQKVSARPLAVSHAFHSRMMEPILPELAAKIAGFSFSVPAIPIVSNLTGALARDNEYDADYWCRHVRHTVRFHDGAQKIREFGIDVCIEIGPDRTLTSLVAAAGLTPAGGSVSSLRRGTRDRVNILAAAKAFYEAGQDLDWHAVHAAMDAPRGRGPVYPFAPTRYWTKVTKALLAPGAAPASRGNTRHWGQEVCSPAISGRVFAFERSEAFPAYLTDHRLYTTVVTPVASHLGTIFSALGNAGDPVVIDDFVCPRALVILEDELYEAQIVIGAGSNPSLSVHSLIDSAKGVWQQHLMGRLMQIPPRKSRAVDREAFIRSAERHINGEAFYTYFRALGYTLGSSFKWIADVWIDGEEALIRYAQPELADDPNDYEIYPGLIDACFQSIAGFMVDDVASEAPSLAVPFAAKRLSFHRRPVAERTLWGHVRVQRAEPLPRDRLQVEVADLHLFDDHAESLLVVDEFRVRHAPRELLQRSLRRGKENAYELTWTTAKARFERAPGLTCIGMLSAAGEVTDGIAAALGACGISVTSGTTAVDRIVDARFASVESASAEDAERAVIALVETLQGVRHDLPYIVLVDGSIEAAPLRQALWGMLAALEAEAVDRRLVRVNLEEGWTAAQVAEVVAAEIWETRIALGGPSIRVARLAQIAVSDPELRLDGSVVVTGGLGALGLSVAQMAAAGGARGIVLMGRSAPDAEASAVIETLKADGTWVDVLAGDVTDPGTCERAFAAAKAMAPLAAVFHLAGANDDQAFDRITAPSILHVFAAKARGAETLARAIQREETGALVFFSSVSGSLGSAGQTNYAAANGYLDGFAPALRRAGVNATSISWGPWVPSAKGGMAASEAALKAAERLGVRPLGDAEAAPLLALAATGAHAHIVAVAADFRRYAGQLGDHPRAAIVADLGAPEPCKAGETAAPDSARGWLRDAVAVLDAEHRSDVLREAIIGLVRDAVGAASVDESTGFADIGLDSIMAIDLRTRLAFVLDTDLPATIAIDYPSVSVLTGFLADLLSSRDPPAVPAPPAAPAWSGANATPESTQSFEDFIKSVQNDLAESERGAP